MSSMLKNTSIRIKIIVPILLATIIGSIFLFILLRNQARENQIQALVTKARAVVLQAEAARMYTADQSAKKVFDKNITDLNQLLYTVPIFSAMEVAKKSSNELGYILKVPKNSPRNPENQPDEFEKRILGILERKEAKEIYEVDMATNSVRYFRPVVLTAECMACHGDPKNSEVYWGRTDGKDITGTMMEGWKEGEVHGAFEIKMDLKPVDEAVAKETTNLAILIAGFIGLLFFMILLISGAITKGIKAVVNRISSINSDISNGKLDSRGNVDEIDYDFKELLKGTNNIIDSFVKPINSTAEYVDRIAKGQIPDKIIDEYKGDFNEIKENINLLIENITKFNNEMNNMYRQHELGNIDVVINDGHFEGKWREMAQGVNEMVKAHIDVKKKAIAVFTEYGNGNFNATIEQLPGKKAFINVAVNKVQNNLNSFINEMNNMSHQHELGDIDVFIDVNKFENSWKEMAVGVNQMVKAHIDVKKKALAIVEEYGKGNFDAQMEMLPGKKVFVNHTLMRVQNNLLSLQNEIVSLVSSAENGSLSTRGNSSNFSGGWANIVDEINNLINGLLNPINEAVSVLQEMAEGNLSTSMKGVYKGDHALLKDSINTTLNSMPFNEAIAVLQKLAEGDLTVKMKGEYKGDSLMLKNALNDSIDSINNILVQVAVTVEEVSKGAIQVSGASNSLSQGATEQAASLEEITSSMSEIGSKTKTNAGSAEKAKVLTNDSKIAAEKGNHEMAQLNSAMDEITESSRNISKIIKVIDEIAFQTNLLALNAAVEAARAGRHGKGFAVVAEEVRNLAARSASAAKETAELIENSIRSVGNGADLAVKTGLALEGIKNGAIAAAEIVDDIAKSSSEQAQAVAQISEGLYQIDKVTQSNTAASEESASAAEELSGQANSLKRMVSKFKITNNHQNNYDDAMMYSRAISNDMKRNSRQLSSSNDIDDFDDNSYKVDPNDIINLDNDDLGRY